jgi:hypothetical protein
MAEILSPSPYAIFDDLPPVERLAAIRLREHRANIDGGSVVETARRARNLQAELAVMGERLLSVQDDCCELEMLADARCAEKQIVQEERDAYRSMCAELVEALVSEFPEISFQELPDKHPMTVNIKIGEYRSIAAALTKARKLLEG